MNLKEITTDAIMALGPCDEYPAERIEALVQRLSTETSVEVLSSIPAKDAFWLIANALPKPERVKWVEACARRAKEYAEEVDEAQYAADWAAYYAATTAQYADMADAAARADADAADWAAHYAARVAQYAAKVAYYAGGIAAESAEQHLAIRHGLLLLEEAK